MSAQEQVSTAHARPASPTPRLAELPDATLTDLARLGDDPAFAELWRRHSAAGMAAARQYASIAPADDLVAESYLRILAAIRRGNGPTEAFRTYLYTTIRNVALRWVGTAAPTTPLDEAPDIDDPTARFEDRTMDRGLLAQAFSSMPRRWQEALWYLEVERMPPAEVGILLGLKPNAVSALGVRAREGLRRAWLQAHVNERGIPADCRWATAQMGAYTRRGLTRRHVERFEAHLATCDRCPPLVAEVRALDRGIAAVLLPVFLGSAAAAGLLASRRDAPDSSAAARVGESSVVAATSAASATTSPGAVALTTIGVVALVAVAGVAVANAGWETEPDAPPAAVAPTPAPSPSEEDRDPVPDAEPATEEAAAPAPAPPAPVVPAPPADTSVDAPVLTSTFPTAVHWLPALSGTGEPGATVTIVDAVGTALGSTTVAPDGSWTTVMSDPGAAIVTLRITQVDLAGNVSATTEVVDAVTFLVPQIVLVDLGGGLGSLDVITANVPDGIVRIDVDGVVVELPADGSTYDYVVDVASVVTARYSNGVTLQQGATLTGAY